jgi:hypothetical protein
MPFLKNVENNILDVSTLKDENITLNEKSGLSYLAMQPRIAEERDP